jgi:hypothetical protein
MLTGVVEVGLFCHMAQAAYFGNQVGSAHFNTQILRTDSRSVGRQRDRQEDGGLTSSRRAYNRSLTCDAKKVKCVHRDMVPPFFRCTLGKGALYLYSTGAVQGWMEC